MIADSRKRQDSELNKRQNKLESDKLRKSTNVKKNK